MDKLDFFTPVTYTDPSKSIDSFLLEKVDDYFYLAGKKAYVMQGHTKRGEEKVIFFETKSSLLAKIGKVFSYFTIVIPVFMLIAKGILRSKHSFKLIDPKQKLEKGLDIPEAIAIKIQNLAPKILHTENDERIEYLQGSKVFKLKEYPQLVFKMGVASNYIKSLHKGKWMDSREIMEDRFTNMINAKKITLFNNLSLLAIPSAKKITLTTDDNQKCTVIAEECMDIEQEESIQKELYYKYAKSLDETVCQLALFVAKTGFNDVTPRNIPILKESKNFDGPRRIALIDLEHMESSVNGFIGDRNGSCGLLRCVAEEQIDIVIAEANKQGITISDINKQQRLQEIADDKKLKQYYSDKGIITGKELIEVDIDSLNLDLTEEGEISVAAFDETENQAIKWKKQTVSLRKVTEDVITEINTLLEKSSDKASLKHKRYVLLDPRKKSFDRYNQLGLAPGKLFLNKGDEKFLWLYRIIQALVEKEHLFALHQVNNYGYFIQA